MAKKKVQVDSKLNVGFGKFKNKLLSDLAKTDLEYFKQIKVLYYDRYSPAKKDYYRSIEKKYVSNNGLRNTKPDDVSIVEEAVTLMKLKWSNNRITTFLADKYSLNKRQLISIMSDVNTLIRKEFESEKSLLLDLHLLRYEEIYLENISINLEEVPAGYRKAVKCEHTITAMETLFQKERLLGVHTKAFKLKANESILEKKQVEFDVSILSSVERLEIFSLLNKAKATETLNRPTIPNNNPLNIEISTKNNELDISDAPIKAASQTDIIGDEQLNQNLNTGKSLIEVQETFSNSLRDKVKELFEKKNKS